MKFLFKNRVKSINEQQTIKNFKAEIIESYLTEVFGPRCTTKDLEDFPGLQGSERCLVCREWEFYDLWRKT